MGARRKAYGLRGKLKRGERRAYGVRRTAYGGKLKRGKRRAHGEG
jgi:hypothetical protein